MVPRMAKEGFQEAALEERAPGSEEVEDRGSHSRQMVDRAMVTGASGSREAAAGWRGTGSGRRGSR